MQEFQNHFKSLVNAYENFVDERTEVAIILTSK